MIATNNKLTALQVELLKSFKHVTSEKQISEIKALLNLYFRHKLDAAIDEEETKRNYSKAIYEQWLTSATK